MAATYSVVCDNVANWSQRYLVSHKSPWIVRFIVDKFCHGCHLGWQLCTLKFYCLFQTDLHCSLCDLLVKLSRSTRQLESGIVSNRARGHHEYGHGWPRWPLVGVVPYQALPHFPFFMYNIHTCEKVRNREGEPGNKAALSLFISQLCTCVQSIILDECISNFVQLIAR